MKRICCRIKNKKIAAEPIETKCRENDLEKNAKIPDLSAKTKVSDGWTEMLDYFD